MWVRFAKSGKESMGISGSSRTASGGAIPACDFHGWVIYPKVLHRPTPRQLRGKGRKGKFPRLAKTAAATSEVRDLFRSSPSFTRQKWIPIHIKNGEAGPMVREVKAVQFYMKRGNLPTRAHWLIVARNPQLPTPP